MTPTYLHIPNFIPSSTMSHPSHPSHPHLNQVVQRSEKQPLQDSALVEFLVKCVLSLSARITSQEEGKQKQWPFAPFSESGICSFDDDWDDDASVSEDQIAQQDTSHWTVEAIAELPGVATLNATDRQRLLVFLDFALVKLRYQSPPSYFETLHCIVVSSGLQPFAVLRLCQELGVWPDDFSAIARNVITEQGGNDRNSDKEQEQEHQLLKAKEMSYEYLGTIKHREVYLAEYLEDDFHNQSDFGGGFETWEVYEFSLTDSKGRVWRFLAESSDDGECLCLTLVRCAYSGIPLSVIKHLDSSTWSAGLQGFVYHPIATEFALGDKDQELPAEDCEEPKMMRERWEKVSTAKFDAGGPEMHKRLSVLQNQWKIAYNFSKGESR